MSDSLHALRRANPRAERSFAQFVEAAEKAARTRLDTGAGAAPGPSRRQVRLLTLAAVLAASAAAAFVAIGPPGGGPGVENATAAIQKAAGVTAASADRSGTALVRITHPGEPWAGKTVRWNGDDLSLVEDVGHPRRVGGELRVVDGRMYGVEDGRWVDLGSPESIDPGSGTTPAEYLAAVREDVGGVTLRRITRAMTGLTASELADGTTVYRGTVAAGLVAREPGFKEGQRIRVFPFGYVAHDEAANPSAPLDAAVTVGSDGVVRSIEVTWGTWIYTVTYDGLGSTPAPVAPEHARPLRRGM